MNYFKRCTMRDPDGTYGGLDVDIVDRYTEREHSIGRRLGPVASQRLQFLQKALNREET
jgi:hypothetical protein